MMFLCYVFVIVCFMSCLCLERPDSEGDSAHSCYLEKVEGGRSKLVLSFKPATKKNSMDRFEEKRCE